MYGVFVITVLSHEIWPLVEKAKFSWPIGYRFNVNGASL